MGTSRALDVVDTRWRLREWRCPTGDYVRYSRCTTGLLRLAFRSANIRHFAYGALLFIFPSPPLFSLIFSPSFSSSCLFFHLVTLLPSSRRSRYYPICLPVKCALKLHAPEMRCLVEQARKLLNTFGSCNGRPTAIYRLYSNIARTSYQFAACKRHFDTYLRRERPHYVLTLRHGQRAKF